MVVAESISDLSGIENEFQIAVWLRVVSIGGNSNGKFTQVFVIQYSTYFEVISKYYVKNGAQRGTMLTTVTTGGVENSRKSCVWC